jgi:hypothetical protein
MSQKIVLVAVFSLSVGLFYLVSPSRGCGVKSTCEIQCYNSSGQPIGTPKSCYDSVTSTGSCECYTDYETNGTSGCHSHCSISTGQDTFCVF